MSANSNPGFERSRLEGLSANFGYLQSHLASIGLEPAIMADAAIAGPISRTPLRLSQRLEA
jgi:hypothetical protein